jgi:Reverse transcriptase (RNA-dependent DNA polymerase)
MTAPDLVYTPSGTSGGEDTDLGGGRSSPTSVPMPTSPRIDTPDQNITAMLTTIMRDLADQRLRLDALTQLKSTAAPTPSDPTPGMDEGPDDLERQIENAQLGSLAPSIYVPQTLAEREEALIDRELQKLRRSIKDLWEVKPTTLNMHNFIAWRTNILSDASLIDAHDVSAHGILTEGQRQPPKSYNRLERAIWNAINDALHARILKSLSVEIRKILPPQRTKNAAALWASVVTRFGITKAQERYNLLRDMCALKLDGSDYMSHQTQWLAYMAALDDLDVTVDDVKHDLFLLSLGNWQSQFVKTKLDDFFASGGNGEPIVNIDLENLMQALQYRAITQGSRKKDQSTSSGSKGSTSTSNPEKSKKSEKSDSDRSPKSRCDYCESPKAVHWPSRCWCKNPEKAPAEWLSENADYVRQIRERNGDPIPDIPGLKAAAPARAQAKAAISGSSDTTDSRHSGNWYLDTCASCHVVSDRKLFTSYAMLKGGEKIGSIWGDQRGAIGVGTVDMKLNGLTVTLKNVRHIPGADSNLVSEALLHDQGFIVHKSSNPPFHYVLETHAGQRFFAVRNSSDVYQITADRPAEAYAPAFTAMAAPTDFSHPTSDEPIPTTGEPLLVAYFSSGTKSDSEASSPAPGDSSEHEHASKASTDIKSAFPKTLWEWHVTLGHLNYRDVLYLANQPSSGVKIKGDKAQPPCQICLQANITRRYSRRKASRATRPLLRIHVDIVGGGDVFSDDDDASKATNLLSRHGFKYFLLITDDATRFRWIYGLISRDQKEISARLRHWCRHINNLGFQTPAFLRSDNEFGSGEFQLVMVEWGSKWEPSNPYSAWQNGAAERANRIVLEKARAMWMASGLPMSFWFHTLVAAVFLANLSPTSTPLYNDPTPGGTTSDEKILPLETRIPIEALTRVPANVSYLLPFGSTVFYHLHGTREPTGKLEPRGRMGRIVGYNGATIYMVWDPDTGRIFNTGDIRPTGTALHSPIQGGEQATEDLNPTSPESSSDNIAWTAQRALDEMSLQELDDPITDDDWVRPAKEFKAFAARSKTAHLTADVPQSFKEAMASADREHWLAACRKEVDDLLARGTWELIRTSDVPIGLRPIPGKWVFAKKLAVDGSTRYKARWVIRGNISNGHQSLWGETAAPVVMASTKLVLFAAAAHYGWHVAQADAITAFLNGKLTNSVYMRQPFGFEQGEKGTLVCKLKQALYGLIPAARIWYDTLREKLEAIGFRASPYDAGLFIHTTKPNLYVTAHVDDFGITGASRANIQWVLEEMGKQFPIKDLGEMKHYLGLQITRTEVGIKLSQPDFISQLLDSAGMSHCNPVSTPIEPGLVIDDPLDPRINTREYQRVTGSLQWLATHTRPDIARIATLLAQFNTRPTPKTVSAQKRVLQYLKGSQELGILFKQGSGALPRPIAYTDSDWGGALTPGRRSCSGYVVLLAGGPISWRSHLQASVALSSNEAEYMAASDAAREIEWLTRLVADMGLYAADAEPISFYMDNKGAHDLVRTALVSKRSKHIDVRYHYVRDIAARGIIKPTPIGTKDMAADGFTKPLAEELFKRFRSQIGLS